MELFWDLVSELNSTDPIFKTPHKQRIFQGVSELNIPKSAILESIFRL